MAGRVARAASGATVLAFLVLLCLQAGSSAAAGPSYRVYLPLTTTGGGPATGGYSTEQVYSLSLHNDARRKAGIAELTLDAKLTAAAQAQAEDMAQRCYFSHTSPEGKTPWDWMAEAGVTFGRAAQNIGTGYVGSGSGTGLIETLFNSMMAETPPDDHHRRSILNPAYRHLGVGIARDGAGNLYWVCNFTD